jgi:hypothetical protein
MEDIPAAPGMSLHALVELRCFRERLVLGHWGPYHAMSRRHVHSKRACMRLAWSSRVCSRLPGQSGSHRRFSVYTYSSLQATSTDAFWRGVYVCVQDQSPEPTCTRILLHFKDFHDVSLQRVGWFGGLGGFCCRSWAEICVSWPALLMIVPCQIRS